MVQERIILLKLLGCHCEERSDAEFLHLLYRTPELLRGVYTEEKRFLHFVHKDGIYMRQRHSAAILTMMGRDETIAESLDHYIRIAVKLGQDPLFRQYISDRIASNKHRVYNDMTCISALEDFLEHAVREKQ
jgi:hypothetical protein